MELRKFSLKWEREREGLLLVKWLKWGRGRAFRLLCEKVHWLSFLRVFILWSLNFYVHIINEKSFLPGFVLQFRLNTHTHTHTHTHARAHTHTQSEKCFTWSIFVSATRKRSIIKMPWCLSIPVRKSLI